jgi:hypothetical protein
LAVRLSLQADFLHHGSNVSYLRLTLFRNNALTTPLPHSPTNNEDTAIDKDRIKGSAEQAKGAP